mmetsp:Transcript_13851/g.25435  ORF Transcript_13851/g.25435 Transcript_13851/m.25435 type:complete len:150 (+) Transcript_13851:33-482(+)
MQRLPIIGWWLCVLAWLSPVRAVRLSSTVTLEEAKLHAESHDKRSRSEGATSRENITGDWEFHFMPYKYEDYNPSYSEYYSSHENAKRCNPDVCRWLSDCYRRAHECRDCDGCPHHYSRQAAPRMSQVQLPGVQQASHRYHSPTSEAGS